MKQIILVLFILLLGWFFLINSFKVLRNVNTMGWVLTCQNELKDVWQYIEQYQDDWDGSFPQSLSQIFSKDTLPCCTVGSRGYCYLAPIHNEIRPLCWDSETHCHKFDHKPYKRNILFSDGHVESFNEKDFFQLMQKFGISDPNSTFSKYIPLPNVSKDIEPIVHQELLDVLEKTDISEIEKLREEFYQYPIDQQLETIAYTLSQGIYSDKTIRLMTGNRDLLNTSFAKYFPKNIRNLEGRALYDAVNIIYTVFPPDPAFIPVLLDHAIESDYVAANKISEHPRHNPIIFSVFITTSKILYKISDKKIGKDYLSSSQSQNEDKKETLIEGWRDTYEKSIKPDLIKKSVIVE